MVTEEQTASVANYLKKSKKTINLTNRERTRKKTKKRTIDQIFCLLKRTIETFLLKQRSSRQNIDVTLRTYWNQLGRKLVCNTTLSTLP